MMRDRHKSNTSVIETNIRKSVRIENNSTHQKNKRHETIANAKRKSSKKSTKMQLQERLLNDAPAKEYIPDEIILATIPGYSPWPARILEISGQTILVEFFGTGQKNLVRPSSICHFDVKTVLPLLNRKGYKKAMIELELCLGIPSSLSLTS